MKVTLIDLHLCASPLVLPVLCPATTPHWLDTLYTLKICSSCPHGSEVAHFVPQVQSISCFALFLPLFFSHKSLGGNIVSRRSTSDINPILAAGNCVLNVASQGRSETLFVGCPEAAGNRVKVPLPLAPGAQHPSLPHVGAKCGAPTDPLRPAPAMLAKG